MFTDTTFGYTQDDSIKVGGAILTDHCVEVSIGMRYWARNGEIITCNHEVSIPNGDTNLDVIEIKGLKKSITLCMDE